MLRQIRRDLAEIEGLRAHSVECLGRSRTVLRETKKMCEEIDRRLEGHARNEEKLRAMEREVVRRLKAWVV